MSEQDMQLLVPTVTKENVSTKKRVQSPADTGPVMQLSRLVRGIKCMVPYGVYPSVGTDPPTATSVSGYLQNSWSTVLPSKDE